MGVTPVEVKKTPASRASSDPWYIFRSEIDRLVDRFSGSGMPLLRRIFEPTRTVDESFGFNAPAVDVTEDEKAFKVAAVRRALDHRGGRRACGYRQVSSHAESSNLVARSTDPDQSQDRRKLLCLSS